jgi:hypothetical protein
MKIEIDHGKACILVVRLDMLAELLQLPSGSYIHSVTSPSNQHNVMHAKVYGFGESVKSGDFIPEVPIIVKHDALRTAALAVVMHVDGCVMTTKAREALDELKRILAGNA